MKHNEPALPNFAFLVYDITRLIRDAMLELMGDLEMTTGQWRAIAHLNRMEGCRQKDLAQTLQISPMTLTQLVDRLEATGYVERRQHETDRRAVSLYLTPLARPLIEKMWRVAEAVQEHAFQGMNTGKREQLISLLESIQSNLSLSDFSALPTKPGEGK